MVFSLNRRMNDKLSLNCSGTKTGQVGKQRGARGLQKGRESLWWTEGQENVENSRADWMVWLGGWVGGNGVTKEENGLVSLQAVSSRGSGNWAGSDILLVFIYLPVVKV